MSAANPATGGAPPGEPPRKIRVLFMQSQDYFGADSRIQADLMTALDHDAFEVHVACNAGTKAKPSAALAEMSRLPGVLVRRTAFGPSVMGRPRQEVLRQTIVGGPIALASLVGLFRYVRQHRIEVVHGTEKPRDAFYGFLLSRFAGASCVVHVHVKAEDWLSRLTQWAMSRADAIVAISQFVASSVRAMGFRPDRIHVIHNGLDLARWDPGRVDGDRTRAEFGFTPETPVLAIVSRMFVWKGHLELIDALSHVVEEHPNVRLLIVGEDDPRAAPGRPSFSSEMRQSVARHGLEENVIFTGFRSDIPELMAACDIFTMPSFEEPFGMVFLEAMALERPVVALDNGGTPEVVTDGVTGLLSAPGDIEQLAGNIVKLIRDPELRRQLGVAGRRRALEFTAASMAKPTEQLYRQLVGLHRRSDQS